MIDFRSDAQKTVKLYIEKEKEFLDTIEDSLSQLNSPKRNPKPDHTSSQSTPRQYLYQQYECEVAAGKFKGKPYDYDLVNVPVQLPPSRSIIRDDHMTSRLSNDIDYDKKSFLKYVNEPTADAIINRIIQESSQEYEIEMDDLYQQLNENDKEIAKIQRKLYKKFDADPNLMKKIDKITYSKLNTAPKPNVNNLRFEVISKLTSLTKELKNIREANDELEKEIAMLEKAQSALNQERKSTSANVSFERKRFNDLSSKLTKQTTQPKGKKQ